MKPTEEMKPRALSYEDFMADQLLIYSRRINERVQCHLTKDRTQDYESQFMALIIHDELLDRFVAIRLSTFRKIVKWVTKRRFITPRKLNVIERFIVNRQLKRQK